MGVCAVRHFEVRELTAWVRLLLLGTACLRDSSLREREIIKKKVPLYALDTKSLGYIGPGLLPQRLQLFVLLVFFPFSFIEVKLYCISLRCNNSIIVWLTSWNDYHNKLSERGCCSWQFHAYLTGKLNRDLYKLVYVCIYILFSR